MITNSNRQRPFKSIEEIIAYLGEDYQREGLLDTPERYIKALLHLTSGYKTKAKDLFRIFDKENYDQMVLLKDIEVYSLCEHHILPFFGKAHVAYIPNKKIVGISKLARLVDMYARRFQIQERIGNQVTSALDLYLKPMGSACIIEAQHLCMLMRGVQKQNSVMVTSSLTGVFRSDMSARDELMKLIRG